ncbi:MAG: hypothetical protein SCALA702_02630 [Melioribacteraceae bacterium]|nr:MAG: hypothetical protein SCALA702_02630 [Melioribacteraceae bacterium]
MGFSTLIDIIGSSIIGGMLLLMLININDTATEQSYVYAGELTVQEALVEVVTLIEHDFRKIGYCDDWTKIPDPAKSILTADSTSISFLTDLNDNGVVDTLRYSLSDTSALTHTPNPRDRYLFRVANSDSAIGVNLGITQFDLEYYDALGNVIPFPVAQPSEIFTMRISVTVENIAAYDENYSNAFWRQIRLAARNLRNR